MLYTISFYEHQRTAIFTLLEKTLSVNADTVSPGMLTAVRLLKRLDQTILDKIKWLHDDLPNRVMMNTVLLTHQELETLASATAFCDWSMSHRLTAEVNVVRTLLKDHGIVNT